MVSDMLKDLDPDLWWVLCIHMTRVFVEGLHMLHQVIGGFFKDFCHIVGTRFTRQLGEIAVFDMRHRFAGKSGFKILDGDGILVCHD